jgi:hypothetical protein
MTAVTFPAFTRPLTLARCIAVPLRSQDHPSLSRRRSKDMDTALLIHWRLSLSNVFTLTPLPPPHEDQTICVACYAQYRYAASVRKQNFIVKIWSRDYK